MLKPKARWVVKEQDENDVQHLSKALKIDPLIGRLLINRGFLKEEQASQFLNISYKFYDPFLLDGMDKAVLRIHKAIEGQEKILVFGDYDADGVSSTSLLVTALKTIGADVSYYVPNRFTEGYGPNVPALEKAHHDGFTLVITVDTGISALESAEAAKNMGLDYIVTDHHEPPPELPDAYCIINPKKPGCPYPFKSLAGVGVAFKLAHALYGEVPTDLLDLAVLGTVADLVPLVDENRLLVYQGLKVLTQSNRPGIKALMEVAGVTGGPINSDTIGFGLGPRLNAAGRMGKADPAIDMLLASTMGDALKFANDLNQLNEERKAIVDKLTIEASAIAEQSQAEGQRVFVISGVNWHAGVIGIVASRLVEKFYRPTIILSIDKETGLAKGSARSIDGFDIFKALSTCRDLLPHFGGHPMAAGMTLEEAHLNNLSSRLNKVADELMTEAMLKPIISIDSMCQIDDISVEMIETIAKLEPYGVANPKPKFLISESSISAMKQVGVNRDHLKITLQQDDNQLDMIGFRNGELFDEISSVANLSAVGELSINEWNNFRKPQLIIDDLAVFEWQLYDFRGKFEVNPLIERLPRNKRRLIAFKQKTVQDLKLTQYQDEIIYFTEQMEEVVEQSGYLVLLDTPDSLETFEHFVKMFQAPERIYAIFHSHEEHFFTSVPTRDQFKWLYALLIKQGRSSLEETIRRVSQYKGWKQDSVTFMIKVFFELGFVKIDKGLIEIERSPSKRPLTDSMMYQKKQQRIELESTLCYSSNRSLKKWFEQYYKSGTKIEEAIVE